MVNFYFFFRINPLGSLNLASSNWATKMGFRQYMVWVVYSNMVLDGFPSGDQKPLGLRPVVRLSPLCKPTKPSAKYFVPETQTYSLIIRWLWDCLRTYKSAPCGTIKYDSSSAICHVAHRMLLSLPQELLGLRMLLVLIVVSSANVLK